MARASCRRLSPVSPSRMEPRSSKAQQTAPPEPPRHPHSRIAHCLVASQGSSCGWQAAKAETGPDQALDAPMVLLNDVVQVFDLPQSREPPQLTIALHGRDRSRIGRVLVDRDRAGVHRVRLAQRLAEEPLGGRGIPLGREQKVDRLAPAVDRPIEVSPASLPLDVFLIAPPRAVARTQMGSDPL